MIPTIGMELECIARFVYTNEREQNTIISIGEITKLTAFKFSSGNNNYSFNIQNALNKDLPVYGNLWAYFKPSSSYEDIDFNPKIIITYLIKGKLPQMKTLFTDDKNRILEEVTELIQDYSVIKESIHINHISKTSKIKHSISIEGE